MILALTILIGLAWLGVALFFGVLISRGVALADRIEAGSCRIEAGNVRVIR